jgi:hypothetical protein
MFGIKNKAKEVIAPIEPEKTGVQNVEIKTAEQKKDEVDATAQLRDELQGLVDEIAVFRANFSEKLIQLPDVSIQQELIAVHFATLYELKALRTLLAYSISQKK